MKKPVVMEPTSPAKTKARLRKLNSARATSARKTPGRMSMKVGVKAAVARAGNMSIAAIMVKITTAEYAQSMPLMPSMKLEALT